jgi:hypothetical protein
MFDICLSNFQWYRKLRRGTWVYLRIDLGERPMFWHRIESVGSLSLSELFAHSHTIIFTEEYE